jgi:hypothetical protein
VKLLVNHFKQKKCPNTVIVTSTKQTNHKAKCVINLESEKFNKGLSTLCAKHLSPGIGEVLSQGTFIFGPVPEDYEYRKRKFVKWLHSKPQN